MAVEKSPASGKRGVLLLRELNLERTNSRTPLFCGVVTKESHRQRDSTLALVLVGYSGRDQITVIATPLI